MHDLIIVGGGPVGSALGLALRDSGLSILLLEARGDAAGDQRSLALSYGSRLILDRIGAWADIEPSATPIESIHVSQRAAFGRALLSAADMQLPALGYVAAYGAVYTALARGAQGCKDLEVLRGARGKVVAPAADSVSVTFTSGTQTQSASARLVVLADGGDLAQASAEHEERDYRQTALVANVRTDRAHANRAYERFTAQGPLALLPAAEGFALIWTLAPERAQQLEQLEPRAFLDALQECFGERAGRFVSVAGRASYPLTLRVAALARDQRVLLLGNAAQTLHPVAGQGLNLGLRDAWALAQQALSAPTRIGSADFAAHYLRSRDADRRATVRLTDTLVRAFSNDLAPLRWLRGCGLTALDCLAPAKRGFMTRMIFGA